VSINALSNAALARRTDFEPANTVPATLSEIAAAAAGRRPSRCARRQMAPPRRVPGARDADQHRAADADDVHPD